MKILDTKGFSVVVILAVLVVASLLGALGWIVYEKQNDSKATNTSANTTNTNAGQEETEISPQPSFNAEQFYSQVQIGMEYNQVVSLAGGQSGACEFSGAPAPNDYMNCTWQDSSVIVSLSFNNQKVTNKSKRSL